MPGVGTEFGLINATGIRRTPESSTDPPVSIHYDPMLAKSDLVCAQPCPRRPGACGHLRRSRLHGAYTNRDLLVNVLRHPRSSPGPPTRRSSIPMDCPGSPHLSPTITLSGCRRSQPALADAAHNRGTAALFPDCRVVGGTSRRDIQHKAFAMIDRTRGFDTVHLKRF